MSYCRWSSNDYDCDLYVYETPAPDGSQWITHVAAARFVLEEALPTRPDPRVDPDGWLDAERERRVIVDHADVVNIELPHAGETFVSSSPGECADLITRLLDLGFHAPAHVIPVLREEQHDLDAAHAFSSQE